MTGYDELDFDDRARLLKASMEPAIPEPTRAEALRAALVSAAALDDIPEPDPLIEGLLFRDSLAWLYGAPGCCKSFVAIDIAGCVGTGESWQGFRVRLRGPVLYLVAEGVTGVKRRVRAWEKAMGVQMEDVHFLPVAVQVSNATEWAALIEVVEGLKPVLVIVDTQARVTVGMEENSATEMGTFVHRVEALRVACGACVLVIHHTGRNGEHMRGSIAMDGAATTLIKVGKAEDIISLECAKQKDAPEFDRFQLRLVPYETSAVLSLTGGLPPSSVDSAAARHMVASWYQTFETDWVSVAMLEQAQAAARATFYRHAKALVNSGLVEETGKGTSKRYRLTRRPESQQSHACLTLSHDPEASTGVVSLTVSPPFRGETGETPPRPETETGAADGDGAPS